VALLFLPPLGVLLLCLLLLQVGGLLALLFLLPLGVLLLCLLLLHVGGLLALLLLLPLGVLLLCLLLLALGILLLPLLLLQFRGLSLLLLLLPLGVLLLCLLLLQFGSLLLLLLLLRLCVLLLCLLLLASGVLRLLLPLLFWRDIPPLGCRGLRNIRLLPTLGFSADRRLNSLNLAHVHYANRSTPGRRILAHLADASLWKRATGVLIQFGLLPLEGYRCRRRRSARYDWPAQHIGGRTWGAGRLCCPRAENADSLRCNLRSRGDAG
jgi:hypothetical protein